MRRLLYWLGLVDLVWTVDSVGGNRVRLRVVYYNVAGQPFAYGIDWMASRAPGCQLNADGSVSHPRNDDTYVASWVPYAAGKPGRDGMKYSMWRKAGRVRPLMPTAQDW